MTEEKELDNFVENLHETLIKLRDGRIEALNDLKEIQIASRTLLQYEALRLEKRFGKEHPRTRHLKARLEQNLEVINDLEVEAEIARIKIPEVSQDEALIHGRVVDKNYRGISGLAVLMTDKGGEKLIDLGKSETDNSGYYSLVVKPDIMDRMSDVIERGIFLTVFTSKDRIVHRELESVKVAKGGRVLVEAVLNREDLSAVREVEKKKKRVTDKA